MTNYHTHTARCHHAVGTDEEYIQSAIAAGFEELGFSDHAPWNFRSGYVSPDRMTVGGFAEYVRSIRRLGEKYKDYISIKVGLECEYYPSLMEELLKLADEQGLDYLLLGNHFAETEERHIYYGECRTARMVSDYAAQAVSGMKSGEFAYIAHPDLFMRAYPRFDSTCEAASYSICTAAKELGMLLEYNLAGAYFNSLTGCKGYPHPAFWEIAAQVGCSAVIGVDAHEPKELEFKRFRAEGFELLSKLGIQVFDSIPMRKPKCCK